MIANRLKKGDTIGLVAPSNPITEKKKQVDEAIKFLHSLGFKVRYGDHTLKLDKYGFSAGTPEQRAKDINGMFANPDINAIWCIQGGETANDLLDLLDYDLIKNNPKIFMGMSDIDVLHLAINKETGLIVFETSDFRIGKGFHMDLEYSQEWFKKRMIESKKEIKPNSEWKILRKGKCEGKIIGCNISSLIKLAGTKYWPDFEDSILFLEDYKTKGMHLMWKLQQLKLNGVFDKIKGLVIGYAYGYQAEVQFDKFGKEIKFEDLVFDAIKDYDFPVIKINEFGHRCDNAFLPIGAKAELDNNKLKIIEDFVK